MSRNSIANLSGPLLKRSDWLGEWRERQCNVSAGSSAAVLAWSGESRSGWVSLDSSCTVRLQGDELYLRSAQRELRFRAAPGGVKISEWHAAIVAAQPPPQFNPALTCMQRFDDALADALSAGHVRLLNAAALRSGDVPRMAHRQA